MAYTPASLTTGTPTLAHFQQVFYKTKALTSLKKKWIFSEPAVLDSLPLQSGKTVQWYRYIASAMVPSSIVSKDGFEGTVGTGIGMTSVTIQATVSQYSDFMSVSDFLKETAMDPIVDNASDQLGYRASSVVDGITRAEIDSANSTRITAATGAGQLLIGTHLRAADIRAARHVMQGLDIQYMDSGMAAGKFFGVVHPYVSYDLVNDPAAGGLMDILKFTKTGPFIENEDRGFVAEVGNVKLWENTNVKNFLVSTTNYWRVYIFGRDAFGVVDLAGKGPSRVSDPSKERFRVNVIPGKPDTANPEGTIGAYVSYNFKFAAKILDSPTLQGQYRYRMLDVTSSIVA